MRPGLLRVLDRLYDTPAQVITDWGDVLAQNAMAAALVGDITARPPGDRNIVRSFFLRRPRTRRALPAEDPRARPHHVAGLRAVVAARPADPEPGGPGRRTARGQRGVRGAVGDTRGRGAPLDRQAVRAPGGGGAGLDCEVLLSAEHAQRLIVHTAAPGTESAERLELLRVVGLQDLTPSG